MICFPARGYEALLLLADLKAGAGPSRFKARTAPPTRVSMSYTAREHQYDADLYVPSDGRPKAGVVLVPGVVKNAKDDPRLVAFATTLARARFAVVVPELAGFRGNASSPIPIRFGYFWKAARTLCRTLLTPRSWNPLKSSGQTIRPRIPHPSPFALGPRVGRSTTSCVTWIRCERRR
jgi:hypothetical protein